MQQTRQPRVAVSVTMDLDVMQRLQDYIDKHRSDPNINRSNVVEAAIILYLERKEKK